MRTSIFTEKEREMAKHYLETGKKDENFRVLIHRCRRHHPKIKEDFDLLGLLLEKLRRMDRERDLNAQWRKKRSEFGKKHRK